FVHELTGDFVETWRDPGPRTTLENFRPKWLSTDLPRLNIYTVGYPTALFAKWGAPEMSLYERAKATLDYMTSYDFGRRPIGFVAHSLGGLIVKQMIKTGLSSSERGWQAIAENCRSVTFLATPHTG